ncbi:glycine cleavage system protein R [Kordiimonas aquimaris]|uniref:glycine cleavage system protein R n=1 Tax=Kordiimonas aquimaris TaxID=707591 RepID=UPI0021CE4DE0|nr:ACT domain-containing protein [Kordiimonas aquimaris]
MVSSGNFLISIIGRDNVGIVSGVSGYLFDIGANLADGSYAVLGEGFEFSCIASFHEKIDLTEVQSGLNALETLEDARITITPFSFGAARGLSAEISHVVEITGGDRPGLIARMSEVLVEYDANIVRMSSKRLIDEEGEAHYSTRFAINADQSRFEALSAALVNTAGSLRLECNIEVVQSKK